MRADADAAAAAAVDFLNHLNLRNLYESLHSRKSCRMNHNLAD